ncbi:alpha-tubulin N-acetyltransferase 1-like [Myzus persicae]|uniref:alpha-tubulin N-acetyltransferase 1-like n=1 Tax=Myzus persicae TaxID=13164 RepID=UPI000B935BC9|nr:alpha-tubulin N-acetyltransferase 1-like [Myzus persicae]XP_022178111.1 alpha-tubulin N-acetyltransferase 1-like [Myzus persicae]XP_022178112.1 alpha-tubulin N-acetyltransferase 1-like [Myzus persicae]
MQFQFNSNNHVGQVLKIDNTLTADGYENNHDLRNNLRLIIDDMGKVSAMTQHLESPITSAEKLINSDHVIYMMTEQNTPANFAVIGYLKMGWKKLFLHNNKQGTRSETSVYCLLDFYIHASKQRQGYGKQLIGYMLQDIKLHPKHLVIDKPTTNLLQFMWKHFQLSKLVTQENNFAVYEDFFDELDENHDNTGNRTSGYNRLPTFGRHGAHKHHDSMGEIIQSTGPSSSVMHDYNNVNHNNFAHHQFKEVKPHTEQALGSLQINKYGDYVERDLKYHHSST